MGNGFDNGGVTFVRHKVVFSFLLVAVFSTGLTGYTELIDKVLASVDTEVILLSEVMTELGPYLAELRRTVPNEQVYNQRVEEQIRATLEQAIDNKILYREALLAGLNVSDDLIEQRLTELRKLYPSEDDFQKDLQASGETMNELRTRLRKQLLAYKMSVDKREAFSKSVSVSEADVMQYYQDHRAEFERPEEVQVRQIFLSAPKDPQKRAEVRARMEQLREELASGADFAALAQAHSEAPGAAEGGIIGWVKRGDLQEALEQAAFALQPGQVSDIIETENGVHLLRVDAKREAGLRSLEEVRKEIEPALRAQEAKKLYDKWMADLRKRSRVRTFLD